MQGRTTADAVNIRNQDIQVAHVTTDLDKPYGGQPDPKLLTT